MHTKKLSCFSVDAKDNKKIHLHMQVPHAQYSSAYNPKEVAKKINSGNLSLLMFLSIYQK